jgi:8-amino-7-oxononanoate synthase
MLRSLVPTPPTDPPLVDFSSNDCLSLSQSPSLRSALHSTLSDPSFLPYGPPSSRLLDGNSPQHLRLESRLASFFDAPSALLFNSGFDANVGLWASLPGPEDWIVFDELVHASMHDGMRGSRVPKERRKRFKHCSVETLMATLRKTISRGSARSWARVGGRSRRTSIEGKVKEKLRTLSSPSVERSEAASVRSRRSVTRYNCDAILTQ